MALINRETVILGVMPMREDSLHKEVWICTGRPAGYHQEIYISGWGHTPDESVKDCEKRIKEFLKFRTIEEEDE